MKEQTERMFPEYVKMEQKKQKRHKAEEAYGEILKMK